MIGFRFHVDRDQVRTCLHELREEVIRLRDHEMEVEEDIVGSVDGFHHGGAEGDVVDEMSVHDIEVQPVATGCDGPRAFFGDTRKVGSKNRGSDNTIGRSPALHASGLTPKGEAAKAFFGLPGSCPLHRRIPGETMRAT